MLRLLHRNQGLLTSTLTSEIVPFSDTISTPPGHQFEYVLHCGRGGGGGEGWEVRVTCAGKKDGQTAAAQAMLKAIPISCISPFSKSPSLSSSVQKLHPYITNWGALLKLYSHPPPSEVCSSDFQLSPSLLPHSFPPSLPPFSLSPSPSLPSPLPPFHCPRPHLFLSPLRRRAVASCPTQTSSSCTN